MEASQSEVARATAERDKAQKDLSRYQKAAGKAVNPFTEQESTNAKQNYLAMEANLDILLLMIVALNIRLSCVYTMLCLCWIGI